MTKLFCFSDCHGFYDELKKALDEAGFDPNNEEHFVVGLGDYLDRGRKPQEVIDYLMGLPRCLLVRGNHTDLIMDCLQRGFPYDVDWHNGTAQTILDLAPNAKTFKEACIVAYEKVKPLVDKMVDYVETSKYIFTHSFVPLKRKDSLPKYYIRNRKYEIDPDWRHAHASAWSEARWGNPYDLASNGFLPDKTLVFGHFHTSWPRHKYNGEPEFGEGANFSVYYGDGYIALDACCAASGKINVLVVNDDFLEDNNG